VLVPAPNLDTIIYLRPWRLQHPGEAVGSNPVISGGTRLTDQQIQQIINVAVIELNADGGLLAPGVRFAVESDPIVVRGLVVPGLTESGQLPRDSIASSDILEVLQQDQYQDQLVRPLGSSQFDPVVNIVFAGRVFPGNASSVWSPPRAMSRDALSMSDPQAFDPIPAAAYGLRNGIIIVNDSAARLTDNGPDIHANVGMFASLTHIEAGRTIPHEVAHHFARFDYRAFEDSAYDGEEHDTYGTWIQMVHTTPDSTGPFRVNRGPRAHLNVLRPGDENIRQDRVNRCENCTADDFRFPLVVPGQVSRYPWDVPAGSENAERYERAWFWNRLRSGRGFAP
jgi:hypothetical protein